ncbi:hypothetical protein SAMN05660297_02776 [Natronincola peptidivorans]|uniref:Uncharacterized protein n=1 Tax=Natronincola peptidivorans TaxID=426128 RepID=A0A1I0FDW3_9FIRM|nr:hypothetical protein [Natronincola peptidivorans]SET56288.1 hypothetical protein SAMN05660297_02776 [Natronincola peptidivorans]
MKSETWERIDKLTEAQTARVEEIVVEDTRLSIEFLDTRITCERKKEITAQIEALRTERLELIGE